jgi:hypothetical protein
MHVKGKRDLKIHFLRDGINDLIEPHINLLLKIIDLKVFKNEKA